VFIEMGAGSLVVCVCFLLLLAVLPAIPGGWTVVDPSDCEGPLGFALQVQNERLSASHHLELQKIQNCQTQVVAGQNFKIKASIEVKNGQSAGESALHSFLVFRGLNGQYQLKSHEVHPNL